ncbi:MAG: YdiU family protein [Pseudobacteriovorax sp.]|nr:YdiU family protein [Pseudobacteriovorax sp.]
MEIPFDNSYSRLPEEFYRKVDPAAVKHPTLIQWNQSLAKDLGIPFDANDSDTLAAVFSGNQAIPGATPLAMAYAGHQFGRFTKQLGDGRAHLLGEVLTKQGKRKDIMLKGSGATPFSRRGDGRSSLGPVIREYLLSEAMHALGIPTTRALAAVATGESVYRESRLPGGVFTRVADSHIRIGTFEYFSSRGMKDHLQALLRYACERHYPRALEGSPDELVDRFLAQVVEGQAALIAKWMSIGFIHGVMNTDNASVAAITIDFGPCAFMDQFAYDRVYSSIDRHGRYAYHNQKQIGLWNLTRLAEALLPLLPQSQDSIERLQAVLNRYEAVYQKAWRYLFARKLGVSEDCQNLDELIRLFLDALADESLDFTQSFLALAEVLLDQDTLLPKTPKLGQFIDRWQREIKNIEVAVTQIRQTNPRFIPRNHLMEEVIAAALIGDYEPFYQLLKRCLDPFGSKDGSRYELPPKPHEVVKATFCGT